MGLFDIFRNKDKQPDDVSGRSSLDNKITNKIDTNSAANKVFDEKKSARPRTDKDIMVDTLLMRTSGGRRESETLAEVIYDREGFEISILEASAYDVNGLYISQPLIFIALPNAESLVCLRPFGKGRTKQEALRSAAEHMALILNSCFDAVYERNTSLIGNSFDGNSHTYRYPLESPMSGSLGSDIPQPMSLFSCILGDLKDYLGAKKYYWINIGISWNGSECNAYVEINGDKCQALSEKMYSVCKRLTVSQRSFFYSQSILIVQSDDTYVKSKENYNAACNAMYEYVRTALSIMGNSAPGDSFETVAKRVEAAVGDKFTAWELMSFLPDVFSRTALNVNCGDTIIMYKDGMKLILNELQLTPFHVMVNEVNNYIKDKPIDGDFISRIMSLSRRFADYADSPSGGIIVPGMIECTAPDGYIIW